MDKSLAGIYSVSIANYLSDYPYKASFLPMIYVYKIELLSAEDSDQQSKVEEQSEEPKSISKGIELEYQL